jgi:deazaflavin-dependent oxidoreductase (nitroreductase family)
MTETVPAGRHAPPFVRLSNPLTRRFLRLGVPMGPNVLLTVRGRTSGEPRSAPVAIVAIDGHRYVIAAYGEVQWVRNLRSAGEGLISTHRSSEHVTAKELDPPAARAFFGALLPTFIARFPWFGRAFARVLFGLAAPEILDDPDQAAAKHPVFELASIA